MAKLIGTGGPIEGQEFPLDQETVIGRGANADITVSDPRFSRRHARIMHTARGHVIADLNSVNGTLLNGSPVNTPSRLRHGDRIDICGHLFKFVDDKVTDTGVASAALVDSASLRRLDETMSRSAILDTYDPRTFFDAHKHLKIIVQFSNAIRAEFDLPRLLDNILDRIFRIFPKADHAFVMLREPGSRTRMVPRVARVRVESGIEPASEARPVSISGNIIEETVRRRLAVLSADAMSDGRFSLSSSVMKAEIHSVMCVPLIFRNNMLGVVSIYSRKPKISFNRQELQLLSALAGEAAFAIFNALLHKRLLEQQGVVRDLQMASQVQHSFLPDGVPEVPGMSFCASYFPAMAVGGDFYDFVRSADDHIGLVVGDVAGKGVSAALLMARMTSDVRFFALKESEPDAILRAVNESLLNRPAGESFLTMLYADINLSTRTVTVANAGHPPPVVRRAAEGEVLEIGLDAGFPIGVDEGAEYASEVFQLEAGDTVSVFTDGVTEAMNDKAETFRVERVHAAVGKGASDPEQVMQRLMADIKRHVGEAPQSDDLTLVCFGPT